jgi:hypothetical protein
VPCAGCDASTADTASPSRSLSLPSTPGAATLRAPSSSVAYASAPAASLAEAISRDPRLRDEAAHEPLLANINPV